MNDTRDNSSESPAGQTAAASVPSIRELPPLEEGGTEARKGFHFQDHVAAALCIDMLDDPSLLEVWCETQDDITLIWRLAQAATKADRNDVSSDERVEFVQVKDLQLIRYKRLILLFVVPLTVYLILYICIGEVFQFILT